ncbi:alpha/beta hydrolase [Shewanella aestuarii]|uniref:Alpha/beta fold hydrolase n=1 Tax=Shewanella aestuarii TaxID=1028752 RepID=A0A6G9QLZ4_9GAMM|nr:alpha/beta fold hydrolase [Shewanella aestuarii]QIR14869.1 alpha/beta fold hydrolase [Shewanella aestuarii]
MNSIVIGSTKHILFALFYAALGIVLALIISVVWLLNSRPELSLWHTVKFKNEYNQQLGLRSFTEYLDLEAKLFKELDKKVYQKYRADIASPINRYERQSLSDPALWPTDWNRSFEWPNPDAEFGLLLLHGMSDSPYSLSHIAQHYQHQAHILGLRLPGHGTIPAGLNDITWPDLAGAVTLATAHLKSQLKDKPLYVVGFSTGAALALNHELEALSINKATSYDKMIFMSPAAGLTPMAQGAYWQSMLGRLLGQEKLYWNSIETEYDPFKYMSFAVNAGDVVYQLTLRNKLLMSQITQEQRNKLPPMLTFQSVIDSTVSSLAVVENLYQYLDGEQHELVMFDFNRTQSHRLLLNDDPLTQFEPFWANDLLDYRLTLVESVDMQNTGVQARELGIGDKQAPLSLATSWPEGVFSLSHIAIPFPIEDTLYGPIRQDNLDTVQIGLAIYQAERGLFSMSASNMLRQKWNPFYPYMLDRMDGFMTQSQD